LANLVSHQFFENLLSR